MFKLTNIEHVKSADSIKTSGNKCYIVDDLCLKNFVYLAKHLWRALVIFIPVVIVTGSGLLLQVKKREFNKLLPTKIHRLN
ncbi:hypothetical protein FM019_07840 [Aliiglaciecola sp. M165]|nr:hypothetical protein FM019_07840 [Aliiglaciecola sp. M165]